jgi:hypothetical protein
MAFLIEHWQTIALSLVAFLGTLTALTETEKDDKIVNILTRIIEAIVLGRSRGKKAK